jgi:ABC transporter substrate binding protein (PQQ-dependent alcohol dehydrogenase system)
MVRSIFLSCLVLLAGQAISRQVAAQPGEITLGYVGKQTDAPPATASDPAIAGARLGLVDNNSTGRLAGNGFLLKEFTGGDAATISAALSREPAIRFAISGLSATDLLALARALPSITFFNAQSPDDALRGESCLPNVLHTIPSRAMRADGLAQYLVWKKWPRWFLVVGPEPGDALFANAIRHAAEKFGGRITEEKRWTFGMPNVHADTGHVTLQSEIPAFTRVSDYDVLVVADEPDQFGEELIGRTALARPVAGTHGLVATGWSPINEQWGALQLQRRFEKQFQRQMSAADYAAWLAVRAVGEAALRADGSEPAAMLNYLRGPEFLLSGFKGQGQSFRDWDGQMRQPILIATARRLVSASPQPGFLHRSSALDTLGPDKDESRCRR